MHCSNTHAGAAGQHGRPGPAAASCPGGNHDCPGPSPAASGGHRLQGKPGAGRPMPLASPPGRPDVVYGFGRIDVSGRSGTG